MGTLHDEPLSAHTSLELGGPARWFQVADTVEAVQEASHWARTVGTTAAVLGGGTNLVVADAGVEGLVLKVGLRGMGAAADNGSVLVTCAAGEAWDDVVAWAVHNGWAGVECLAGIPGTVGAVPIQNVGAYGQEVADVIQHVEAVERSTGEVRRLAAGECGFGYRTSRFRRRSGDYIVTSVTLRLAPGGPPAIRYAELERRLAARGATPDLVTVREAVLDLRRSKSMVLDDVDPNRRSVGSFFVNPVMESDDADRVARRARAMGVIDTLDQMPRFPTPDGRVKLAAAWLIERAGFERGMRAGRVGISSAHTLALVHHGDGTTRELLDLARTIRDRVDCRFGVTLRPEPIFWGFAGQSAL